MLGTRYQEGNVDLERDRSLVDRCQRGDQSAFGDLYLRYRSRLYRYCLRRLGNPSEAEDAVQEAFARAWKALPSFAGERLFYPWLRVIANNLCVDIQRSNSRCAPLEENDLNALLPVVSGGQELLIERAGEHDLLSRALENLSDRHREVLDLREGQNWTYQQIASHAGVEVSTVETLLFRARRSLKNEFMQLARAEGALGVILAPLFLLRRWVRRLESAVRAAGAATKGAMAAAALPLQSGAIGGVMAALATTAIVATSVTNAGGALASHSAASSRSKAAVRARSFPSVNSASGAIRIDTVSSDVRSVSSAAGLAPPGGPSARRTTRGLGGSGLPATSDLSGTSGVLAGKLAVGGQARPRVTELVAGFTHAMPGVTKLLQRVGVVTNGVTTTVASAASDLLHSTGSRLGGNSADSILAGSSAPATKTNMGEAVKRTAHDLVKHELVNPEQVKVEAVTVARTSWHRGVNSDLKLPVTRSTVRMKRPKLPELRVAANAEL